MAVYTSKFTGEEIDAALEKIATLEERLTTVESKEDKDTVYDDTELAARVKALEDRLAASTPESTPGQDPSQDTNSGTGENPEGTPEGTPEQNTENIISENSEKN